MVIERSICRRMRNFREVVTAVVGDWADGMLPNGVVEEGGYRWCVGGEFEVLGRVSSQASQLLQRDRVSGG
ncbi:hypothetical protein CYL20_14110 [Pseudomonas palleroniana]|uniref:Uncharacterized protein n=1 Tax=Pseudomonas palleroniana TaxID=191390 RepID=A0A2L1JAW9_9PSED|nr:hypothetical protein CYL20_14110 [Pseudomonas palleroniana]